MFNKKQLFFIILKNLARAGVVIFVAVLVIIFFSKQISKISHSIAEQRALSFVLEKRNETLEALRKDFEIIDGADDQIQGALPPADNILDFVSDLEDLGDTSSLNQTFAFESPNNSVINYSISISADIFSFIKYLKDFEKLPYFTSITGMNLSAPHGDWNGNSVISLRSKVYIK